MVIDLCVIMFTITITITITIITIMIMIMIMTIMMIIIKAILITSRSSIYIELCFLDL